MRAVICVLSPSQDGNAVRCDAGFRASGVCDGDTRPVGTLKTASVCLGLDWGDPAPHCWQGWTSLFGYPSRWWRPAKDQRSPLRRCFKPRPLRRAGCAGFASSCRSDVLKSFRSPGGWPASCPATYRSTHGHRHVRNWARIEIIYLR